MKAVIMPRFGFTQEESEILEWKVKDGDRVEQGDPLAVVSTDKVSMEVEAPEAGIVAGIRYPQGAVVRVTEVIAYILQPGESLPADSASPSASSSALSASSVPASASSASPSASSAPASASPSVSSASPSASSAPASASPSVSSASPSASSASPSASSAPASASPSVSSASPSASSAPASASPSASSSALSASSVPASASSASPSASSSASLPTPVAARLAADLGLDVTAIPGSGPGGRITRADVERYAAALRPDKPRAVPAARRLARELGVNLSEITGSGPRGRIQSEDVRRAAADRAPAAFPAPVAELAPGPARFREIPLQGMRKTIAANMLRSWQSIPTIHLEVDVDMEASLALLQAAQSRAGERKVSLTAVVARAVAWALRRHPRLNAHLEGETLREWDEVHLGMAVALEDGLIVPVLHHPDRKGILQIAEELNDLAARARANQLRLSDLQDATFTISNLGMFGIDRFTAIINPPQVAILAVSALKKVFVANEIGQPVLHSVMNLRLSADHRAVDGAVAARFMADLRKVLENPSEMLLWQ